MILKRCNGVLDYFALPTEYGMTNTDEVDRSIRSDVDDVSRCPTVLIYAKKHACIMNESRSSVSARASPTETDVLR